MFKPLFEEDGWKPSDKKRPVPTHNTEHPKNLRVRHEGRSNIGGAQTPIVVEIRHARPTLCGLRDKMALSASSAKRGRLVNANVRLDERLDTVAPCLVPPPPVKERARRRSSYTLASRILGV